MGGVLNSNGLQRSQEDIGPQAGRDWNLWSDPAAQRNQGVLQHGSEMPIGLNQKGVGRLPDLPWMHQLSEVPDLRGLCRLNRSDDRLDIGPVCTFLEGLGCERSKIDTASKDYIAGNDQLGEFFRKLSDALGVTIELRIKNREGAIKDRLCFESGMPPQLIDHNAFPQSDQPVYQFTLHHDGNKWQWGLPALSRNSLHPNSLAPGMRLPINVDKGWFEKQRHPATDSPPQNSPLPGSQHSSMPSPVSSEDDRQNRKVMEAQTRVGDDRAKTESRPATAPPHSDAAAGLETPRTQPLQTPKCFTPHEESLLQHVINVSTQPDGQVVLKENTEFGKTSREKIGNGLLTSDGESQSPAINITQKCKNGTARSDSCWVMSGLYALMSSKAGRKALRTNVKFDHPSEGRMTVAFPGFKTTVELKMEVPLVTEEGQIADHQVYSDSAPDVELLARAVDILRQYYGCKPVQDIGEPQYMMQAFGLHPLEVNPERKERLKKIITNTLSKSALPVTLIWGGHVRALHHFGPNTIKTDGGTLVLFNPLDPDRKDVFSVNQIFGIMQQDPMGFGFYIGQSPEGPELSSEEDWISARLEQMRLPSADDAPSHA